MALMNDDVWATLSTDRKNRAIVGEGGREGIEQLWERRKQSSI